MCRAYIDIQTCIWNFIFKTFWIHGAHHSWIIAKTKHVNIWWFTVSASKFTIKAKHLPPFRTNNATYIWGNGSCDLRQNGNDVRTVGKYALTIFIALNSFSLSHFEHCLVHACVCLFSYFAGHNYDDQFLNINNKTITTRCWRLIVITLMFLQADNNAAAKDNTRQ